MIINVKVRSGASLDKIEKISEGKYNLSTTKRAVNGNANVEVIKMLSKEFKVSFKNIKIKNPKSRNKIVEIIIA